MKAYIQKVDHTEETSFVYRVKADPKFSRGRHFHPEFELTYIQSSSGRRFVGESIENYRSGDLVLLGSNLPHAWISGASTAKKIGGGKLHRAIVIQFSRSFLGQDFLRSAEMVEISNLLARASRGLRILGKTRDEVAERMRRMRRMERFDRLLELLRVLQIIARGGKSVQPICEVGAQEVVPRRRAQRRIDQILAYLDTHHAKDIRQSEIATLAGMNSASFSRFFRTMTGTTFVAHLNRLRVSSACNMLLDSDLSVLEVSSRAGFNNLSNFNRQFLASMGMTPSAYRRRGEL